MLGVKLTILGIASTIVYIFYAVVSYKGMNAFDQLRIQLTGEGPRWWKILCYVIGLLVLADTVGIVYTVVYLLFFR